ncbi:MAG: hypothetical protein KGO05_16380 [Chloroflexota bacterium]|nr:hypothetical protein [Chloroflexota bacterium]
MSGPRVVRRASVWALGLHVGGCSACAESVAALAAPRYARRLRALGVTFARTPRQADILLLSGALTEQARASLEPLIAGTPRPRALVAIGDCAINGCVFAGSAALTAPLAQVVGANVEIAGCPPAPQAIIEAIAQAQRLLMSATAPRLPLAATGADADAAEADESPPDASPDASPEDDPQRAGRLSALFATAGGDWDDEEDSPAGETANNSVGNDHQTKPRDGATRNGARQSEEKRSE